MPIVDILGHNQRVSFPDDMTPEQMREVLRRKFRAESMSFTPPSLEPQGTTMEAYSPSLRERMSKGVSDALYNSGAISDRYRAQNVGDNLTSLAEFVPGVGDVVDADEFGRAAASGDIGGMAMAGLGVIPVVGDAAQKGLKGFTKTTGDTLIDSKIKNIVMMSPDEYLKESFKVTDGALGGDFQSWMSSNAVSKETMEGYAEAMKKGDEFPLPYIDYLDGAQDGRNRALAAKKAGVEKIPVGVVPDISDKEKIKIILEEMKTATGLKKYRLEQQLGALNYAGK